jgi:nicotinamidase/pyrazinamidase
LKRAKVLLCIDIQNDFCPGGNLAVANGAKIIPNINKLMEEGNFNLIVATQDWHGKKHISFASNHDMKPFEVIQVQYGQQMLWPDHCVQDTYGAELHKDLNRAKINYTFKKGYNKNIDIYSSFFENDKYTDTGLDGLIRRKFGNNFDLYIVGIATDVCVYNTAIDAKSKLNYEKVVVIENACAGVTEEGTKDAIAKMKQNKIIVE